MKKLLTSKETASPWIAEGAKPSEARRKSAAAQRQEAQKKLKNPVILALRRIDESRPATDRQATERLRIASEVIQHLGWPNAAASHGSDVTAVQAFRERCSKEQVQRTRTELESYLDRSRGDEDRWTRHQRRVSLPREPLLRNPILAALAGSQN